MRLLSISHIKLNFFTFHDESYRKFILILPHWCLGTLLRVPDKEEKVPRLAPWCRVGCNAYAAAYKLRFHDLDRQLNSFTPKSTELNNRDF